MDALYILKVIVLVDVLVMAKLNAFSRLKNIFSRLNPIPSFKWDGPEDEIIIPLDSRNLLEKTIGKYPEFEKVILVAIYHLFNTKGKNDEYLIFILNYRGFKFAK